ncbi:NUDIX domain-containing protein [Microbacteriaceae bacterium VKM Ac-2855]|nr:NUDIX domain-containing protein [Microbacteriaceae bacterium VKM Ac-2855]
MRAWAPVSAEQRELREEYLAFFEAHGDAAVRRDSGAEHVTASCFVFSPDLARILLCFHGKARFWVQLGGHIEPTDATLAAAALREAREEGGIPALTLLSELPGDLDRHPLSSRFGRCSVHWDIGFAATAAADARPQVSDESEDVRWFDVDALPVGIAPQLDRRIANVLATLRRAP